MAERPVFVPAPDAPGFVREHSLDIAWADGAATLHKQQNIQALHRAAAAIGLSPLLEVSTMSSETLGQSLSAFNVQVKTACGEIPLECAYQGSKVFERGGPYTDLHAMDARSAKRDPRLQCSGRLIAFSFEGNPFPLEPRTVFYDWLYITAIFPQHAGSERLLTYAGFTDIAFNPKKSINCQARSCALFVSLKKMNVLSDAVRSPKSFIGVASRHLRADSKEAIF